LAGMIGHWPWQAIHIVASCLSGNTTGLFIHFCPLQNPSFHPYCIVSPFFSISNMDLSRLSAEQLTQFQSLLHTLHTPQQDSSMTSVSSTTASSQLPVISNAPSRDPGQAPRQVTPPHSLSSSTALTAPIGPYHGMHATQNTVMTSQGHPSLGVSSQPFLGLECLGLSMAGQTNQRRMASAANTLPRQPRLPRRGRGPAVAAPSLRRSSGPRIEDCLSIPDAQGNPTIRVKVKVYVRNTSQYTRT
jgi:hypothetical protein